jgi:oligopeptidase B
MKRLILFLSLIMVIISCNDSPKTIVASYKWPEGLPLPVAEKKNKELVAHGDTRIDEYYWMNDYFKKGPDSTKVVEYLKAENAYMDTMMSGTKTFGKNFSRK